MLSIVNLTVLDERKPYKMTMSRWLDSVSIMRIHTNNACPITRPSVAESGGEQAIRRLLEQKRDASVG
jgi:hypothetical protein